MIYTNRKWSDGRAFSADTCVSSPSITVDRLRVGVWLETDGAAFPAAVGLPVFYFRIVGELVRDVSSDGTYNVFDRDQRVRLREDDRGSRRAQGDMGTVKSGYQVDQSYRIPIIVVFDKGSGDTFPFNQDEELLEHVSEHALPLQDLMSGKQPWVTSGAHLAPRIEVRIDDETRTQMLVWWDQHGGR